MREARPDYEFVQKHLKDSIVLFRGPSRIAFVTIISISLVALFVEPTWLALVAILTDAAIGGSCFAYEVRNGTTQEKARSP